VGAHRLQELEIGVVNFKARVTDEERTSARNEIEERDTQINRLKKKVDELGKQLSQTQSELKSFWN
jgi:peptidoglycan hydrolase CwlO-like protein